MAFTTVYSFNLKKDAGLVAEKQWVADVLRLPSTVASGETAPTITTGPLGATGKATANYTHGDATSAGFASPLDALQKGLVLAENDRALNGDS